MNAAVVERARGLLSRPDAWVEQQEGETYRLRLSRDRRRRAALTLDEAAFRALAERPGLAVLPGGGWGPRRAAASAPSASPPGHPGLIEGAREVMGDDGRLTTHRANLGETPIAWLARRKDADGRPFLAPAEVAAGERLRADAEAAARGVSLTMRWDALPRAGAGGRADATPGDRALAAGRRVAAALTACGPRLAPVAEAICVRGSSLQLAERELGLRRRHGKSALKAALQALAAHYRIGC